MRVFYCAGESMKIDINAFKSAVTATIPELLQDGYASSAINVETINGAIEPIRQTEANADVVTSILTNSISRIFFRGNASLVAQGIKNESWVASPLANDDYDRVYWTRSNGSPMVSSYSTFGVTDYELGIDKPGTAITVSTAASSGDELMKSNAIFVEVSEWGELSEPCNPSADFSILSAGSFSLNFPAAPVSGHWTHRQVFIADYSGNYLYHSTIPNTQASLQINLPFDPSSLVSELDQIVSGELNSKPRAGMQGLVTLPGGILAGYEKNVVCFSRAYLPHAWPPNFEITVDGNIKAIKAAASGLVVITDKSPYLIVGASPGAMSPVQIDMIEPCVAPFAAVDMGSFVVYPSNDGLIAIAGQNNRNLIDGVIDRDEWRSYVKPNAVACAFNGKYWYFSDNGGFVFDIESQAYSMHDISAIAVHADYINDQIYIVTPGGALTTYSRSALVNKSLTWASKVYEVGDHASLSAAKIASIGDVTFKVDYTYRDANQVQQTQSHTHTAKPYQAFRLPAVRADSIKITLSGDCTVKRVQLASSMQELS